MLKALELNGFKSFADRTRFEFPEGITVVVGPNGSGKSNVVDAIKWVLGAQSVKALRGKEMTDVIFSGAHGRGQTNAAEVSLILDNSAGAFDFDSSEIQVTRRVYRSGEAEYLINRQQCRLRDIKDVFAGTGMSSGAYSIIEQGKVDALLQSSPRERRLIFEEAAGISRFRQKKQEAARRLERIDQNLLRLSDIVDELDSRLRSVRSQAGKAQKYKQCSDRLKELRTQVGLTDWRSLTVKLNAAEEKANAIHREQEEKQTLLSTSERQLRLLEQAIDALQAHMQEANAGAATTRERIAQCESTRRSQLARSDELLQESERMQRQLLAMTSKAGNAQQLVAETTAELSAAEQQFTKLDGRVSERQSEVDELQAKLAELQSAREEVRQQHAEAIREASRLEHQIELYRSQQTQASTEGEQAGHELELLQSTLNQLRSRAETTEDELAKLDASAASSSEELQQAQKSLRQSRSHFSAAQVQLADLKGRLTGARERATVLEELERRLDGLSSGTKEVLRRAQDDPTGPYGCVRGVVADLLRVDADTASLVETALGDRANHLLIDQMNPNLVRLLEQELPGRTNFLRLDVPQPASAVDQINLAGEPGVIGRADQFVEAAADLITLPRRLLGRYWLVDTLRTALQLSQKLGRGLNFVTVVGEVVAADGTLTVGPQQSTTGLLSRRSELRALLDEIQEMQQRLQHDESQCQQLQQQVAAQESAVVQLSTQNAETTEKLNEVRLQTASLRQQLTQAEQQAKQCQATVEKSGVTVAKTAQLLEDHQNELNQVQQQLATAQSRLEAEVHGSQQLQDELAVAQQSLTDERVEFARSEQRRDGLRRQMAQLEQDHQEHDRALAETRNRVEECQSQREELQRSVEAFAEELKGLYAAKEDFARQVSFFQAEHDLLREEKADVAATVEQLRTDLAKLQAKLQQVELSVQQLEHQRSELGSRMSEDYGIELAVLASQQTDEEADEREEIEAEIRQLREQLQAIGHVNLEALNELEAVEERHSGLAKQYHDLQEAKNRLQQLVSRINGESRDLFVQSLEIIRGHFQDIYRSLFGGGEADVVMQQDEEKDVLECGIEIVARPPGKQPRNISLLSGGERTLTCVALLLAIFRSRPSPFCVLDEVDAALDEANIDRFSDVLREFMDNTQFIVVSHSKRTMSCADTLYGVTMQESGVSKRVSVRFEDVSADGRINESAGQARAA